MEDNNTFEFVKKQLFEYVRKKASSFLEINGIGDQFQVIEADINVKEAKGELSFTSKIDTLLQATVTAVADSRKEEWNKIRDEFNAHYLAKH